MKLLDKGLTCVTIILLSYFTLFLKVSEANGVLKVRFHDYVNPKRQDYDGGCCELGFLKCDDCDTYFEICLQHGSQATTSGKCFTFVTTKKLESDSFYFSRYGATFGVKGEKNPLEYHFDNTWQGAFSIYMNIWDDDGSNFLGIGSKRDRIDRVLEGFKYLVAATDASNPRVYTKTLTGLRTRVSPTTTNIVISLYCDTNYYGGYCTTYCKPEDSDASGHYTCKAQIGEKICRPGWTGKGCKTPICKKGCKNGHCKKPGECICSNNNWSGALCDQCTPTPGCGNGVCVKGGDCVCLQDWSGPLCDQDMNSCRSSPCQHGALCRNNRTSYYCDCVPGYQGVHCENEIDLCSPNPCLNNASCLNYRTNFQCRCPPGFKGRKCEENIDECKILNYCRNNATCVDGINNYTCVCQRGFQGRYCGHNIDDCLSNSCQNGTCVDGINNYTCSCSRGFKGRHCEENIDDCTPNPCKNNGNCTDDIDDFVCSCLQGWVGKTCSSNNDECAGNPCRNNGTCHDRVNDYSCTCLAGFTGKDCQIDINDCELQPCQNNGVCIDGVNSYSCDCKPGYTAQNCTINIDECNGDPCLNGGRCIDGVNQYFCQCPPGFAGLNCQINIDECLSDPCLNGGSCIDLIANFTCNCTLGYEGHRCESRIDYCKNAACLNKGQCVSFLGGYQCKCRSGYNGTHCENTPCTWQPCQHNSTCVINQNVIGGFKCKCSPGYDGPLCENDIDYCDPANNDFIEGIGITEKGLCGFHGTCVDELEGYKCVCDEGWEGFMCDRDIDECYRYRPCQNNGDCRERVDEAGYHCICPTGYNGTNCETMIDFCERNPCCDGATCIPILNSFICNCSNGLRGPSCCSNDTWCSRDKFNVSTCSNHGQCTDNQNTFNCSCPAAYTGLRCETDIDECQSNPCINGECINLPGTYECVCNDYDMAGKNCEKRINDCENIVCQNNGTCADGVLNYTCECQPGYTGRHCAMDINECAGQNNCSRTHSVCRNTNGSYYCECHEPFHNPPECTTVVDYCEPSPCLHGTCSLLHKFIPELSPELLPYDYVCDCYEQWEGRHCDTAEKWCPCEYGDCVIENGKPICQCNPGYQGNECSETISAESYGGRNTDSKRPMTIGMSLLGVSLIVIVLALLLIIRRRRYLARKNEEAVPRTTVKFTKNFDDTLDPMPEPLMFVNPLYDRRVTPTSNNNDAGTYDGCPNANEATC